jgi:predicted DNA-binding protein (MmcQ/YjbR family)/GNAT superfamily N-acetyltransferase
MDKMFAYIHLVPKDGRFRASMKCNRERSADLRARYTGIVKGDYTNDLGWNAVYLDSDVPDPLIEDLIHHSVSEVISRLSKKQQTAYHALNDITLALLTDADIPLVMRWIEGTPHVRRWYEFPDEWRYELEHRHDEFAFIRHFIALHGQRKVGFCQYYDYFYHQEESYPIATPQHTYCIDYLIGEENYLRKGLGKAIIRALVEEVRALGAAEVVSDPMAENEISCRTLLSQGFKRMNKDLHRLVLKG